MSWPFNTSIPIAGSHAYLRADRWTVWLFYARIAMISVMTQGDGLKVEGFEDPIIRDHPSLRIL